MQEKDVSQMLHTNLVLGANWLIGEWPESVDVMHEGAGDSIKYVPERTCHAKPWHEHSSFLRCSECGGVFARWFSYCPSCGAKLVEE